MNARSPITTHVLDTARGKAAQGVPIRLERKGPRAEWLVLGKAKTNADGRAEELLPKGSVIEVGIYRLTFTTAEYFGLQGTSTFYPEVAIEFEVSEPKDHHHVPLLLSPFGYSTYRGT